jgi:RNA polymerase sigma-70 factor (ECF subfamily)
MFRDGQQRWPCIAISLAQWERGLEIVGVFEASETLRSTELFLTVACSYGDAAAIATLEREYLASIFGALAKRFQLESATSEDALQRLREKLLVHRPQRVAAILDYQGAGALGVWLHVVTLRELISQHRQLQRQRLSDDDDRVLDGLAGTDNPALQVISKDSQAHVKEAYRAALARLAVRQRLILRMHICDRLSLEAIAATYNVNRVTVARWLDRARCDVAQWVREQLLQALQLAPAEVESLLRNVQSQFELSVERLL